MAESSFWRRQSPTIGCVLQQAGLLRAADILLRAPLRYENWQTPPPSMSSLKDGQTVLVEGVIVDAQLRRWRGGRRQLLIQIEDGNGDLLTARFFNVTPALEHSMSIGRKLRVRGVVKLGRGWEMTHPKIQSAAAPGKMQAVYSALGGLSQDKQRRLIPAALAAAQWDETVPENLRQFHGGAWSSQQAIEFIHMPPPDEAVAKELQEGRHIAWRRLRFDELLAHQIILRVQYRRRNNIRAPQIQPPPQWDEPLRESLPFVPTAAQQKAIAAIINDLRQHRPMHRLLQGDVGSGKTAVAAFACLAAAKSGQVAVFMAPTDILARQHYQTLGDYFRSSQVECELLIGAVRGGKRRSAIDRARMGLSRVVVGTHALFYEEKRMPKAGLVIIDEQHRFGVEQRRALFANGATHQLMMSATPIPRTLAMSMFANMDISLLDELPPGRRPVVTVLVPCARRAEVLRRIGEQKDGAAYWVCPRIDDSDKDELQDVSSLLEQARRDYPALSPTVLHGRMSSAEKQDAIDKFRGGKTRLLVATTVIEVGVDVPQADVMVVDHAERMGLSQLHQLRGRVGRGGRDGFCVLLYADNLSADAKSRLKILRETKDGFKIAEEDLRLRGPGEWLGTRQSGLPGFRMACPGRDMDLTAAASAAAEWLLDNDRRAAATLARRWLRGRR